MSLKPGVLKCGRLRRLQKVLILDSKMWISQEIQESTNLMGVTMTMPWGHAIWTVVLRWIVLEKLQLLGQLRSSLRLEKTVALQLWTKFNVSNLEVMAIRWRRRLLRLCLFKLVMPRPGLKRLLFLISRRWLSQHRCVVNFDPNNLCLESPEFGAGPLVLHSSGHLLLSLVNPSNTLDQIHCHDRFSERFIKHLY